MWDKNPWIIVETSNNALSQLIATGCDGQQTTTCRFVVRKRPGNCKVTPQMNKGTHGPECVGPIAVWVSGYARTFSGYAAYAFVIPPRAANSRGGFNKDHGCPNFSSLIIVFRSNYYFGYQNSYTIFRNFWNSFQVSYHPTLPSGNLHWAFSLLHHWRTYLTFRSIVHP